MELVEWMLRWEVIVATAIVGAAISMVGSAMITREGLAKRGGAADSDGEAKGTGRSVLRVGYTITFVSIGLFIVAGFMSGD